MERRSFLRGAFGLAVLAVGGLAALSTTQDKSDDGFVTPDVALAESVEGPVMAAGIRLVPDSEGSVHGYFGDTLLFNVDEQGAELMRLADGSMTIDELASALSIPAKPADVASFFVTLGQAGFLQNTVLVNLVENPA